MNYDDDVTYEEDINLISLNDEENQREYLLSREEYNKNKENQTKRRKLFEGCISREQTYYLACEFAKVFGDDRVIEALMFSGMPQLGLYEILVSCAACAADPHLFN